MLGAQSVAKRAIDYLKVPYGQEGRRGASVNVTITTPPAAPPDQIAPPSNS